MKMDDLPNVAGSVFVAIGTIDYESDHPIGVLTSLDAAKQRCLECPTVPTRSGSTTAYDRYRIEEWPIGATEPTARWYRDNYAGGSTEWRSFAGD